MGGPFSVPTDGNVEVIVAPDEVAVDQDFEATITTIGPNGCWSVDGADVDSSPLLAEIMPWDRVSTDPEIACTQALVALARTVTLRFTEKGDATIRVLGRRVVDGELEDATTEVVEKTVRVR